MIKQGEKINVKRLLLERDTFINSFYRTLNGESRATTQEFIYGIIQQSFNCIDNLSINIELKNIVIHDLRQCIHGLTNLEKTYENDKLFVCSIHTLIQTIESKLMVNELMD